MNLQELITSTVGMPTFWMYACKFIEHYEKNESCREYRLKPFLKMDMKLEFYVFCKSTLNEVLRWFLVPEVQEALM